MAQFSGPQVNTKKKLMEDRRKGIPSQPVEVAVWEEGLKEPRRCSTYSHPRLQHGHGSAATERWSDGQAEGVLVGALDVSSVSSRASAVVSAAQLESSLTEWWEETVDA